jgi:hypothetical protein
MRAHRPASAARAGRHRSRRGASAKTAIGRESARSRRLATRIPLLAPSTEIDVREAGSAAWRPSAPALLTAKVLPRPAVEAARAAGRRQTRPRCPHPPRCMLVGLARRRRPWPQLPATLLEIPEAARPFLGRGRAGPWQRCALTEPERRATTRGLQREPRGLVSACTPRPLRATRSGAAITTPCYGLVQGPARKAGRGAPLGGAAPCGIPPGPQRAVRVPRRGGCRGGRLVHRGGRAWLHAVGRRLASGSRGIRRGPARTAPARGGTSTAQSVRLEAHRGAEDRPSGRCGARAPPSQTARSGHRVSGGPRQLPAHAPVTLSTRRLFQSTMPGSTRGPTFVLFDF